MRGIRALAATAAALAAPFAAPPVECGYQLVTWPGGFMGGLTVINRSVQDVLRFLARPEGRAQRDRMTMPMSAHPARMIPFDEREAAESEDVNMHRQQRLAAGVDRPITGTSCGTSRRRTGHVSRRCVRAGQRGQLAVRGEYRRGSVRDLGDHVRPVRSALVRPSGPAQRPAGLLGAVLLVSMLAGNLGEPAQRAEPLGYPADVGGVGHHAEGRPCRADAPDRLSGLVPRAPLVLRHEDQPVSGTARVWRQPAGADAKPV
ncbi:hypothetical protein [Dactylosporangium sp. CA-139066]|uniref:hypothetical protein n=1 Tax=Dactylosporangium sp. CA-139066 TaxID=3239930 RepID=UPI003D9033BB